VTTLDLAQTSFRVEGRKRFYDDDDDDDDDDVRAFLKEMFRTAQTYFRFYAAERFVLLLLTKDHQC